MLMGIQGDAPGMTGRAMIDERRLIKQDVAEAWPTTTTRWVRESGCTSMQATLRFPQQDLEGPDNGAPIKGSPTGLLG